MANWHAVLPWDELLDGMTEVVVAGELLLLVRDGSSIHACAATCPHKFTGLVGGTLENGCLTCPMHNASFSLESGRPLPGQEWASNLPIYPVRINEGIVEVQV